MKRVGSWAFGPGVDKIYRGMLRFGRPRPDCRRTDVQRVVLADRGCGRAFRGS